MRFSELMQDAFPASEVTPELDNRIYQLAREHVARDERKLQWRGRVRIGFLSTCAIALLCMAILLEPRLAFAYALRKVKAAIGEQRSIHVRFWTVEPDGSREISREIWSDGENSRMETGGGENIFITRDEKQWEYDRAANTAIVRRVSEGTNDFSSAFTGRDLLDETVEKWGEASSLRMDDAGHGQVVFSVVGRNERGRARIWVDKSSDLPIKSEMQLPHGSGWQTIEFHEFSFEDLNASELFQPKFPEGTVVQNQDEVMEQLNQRWQRALYTYSQANDYIDIRDVQVNREGDLFVLFTTRMMRISVRATDDLGTVYVPLPVQLYTSSDVWLAGNRVHRFRNKRGQLTGVILTPLKRVAWRPRTIHLIAMYKSDAQIARLRSVEVVSPQRTVDYKVDRWKLDREWMREDEASTDTGQRTFTLQFENPTCEQIPSFTRYMTGGITFPSQLEDLKAKGRGEWLMDERRYADAEAEFTQELNYLAQAGHDMGSRYSHAEAYMDLYEALAAQGKHEEAVFYLKQVEDEMSYPKLALRTRLNAALEREGLR